MFAKKLRSIASLDPQSVHTSPRSTLHILPRRCLEIVVYKAFAKPPRSLASGLFICNLSPSARPAPKVAIRRHHGKALTYSPLFIVTQTVTVQSSPFRSLRCRPPRRLAQDAPASHGAFAAQPLSLVRSELIPVPLQAQTPEQRRRNAKFVKEQDARRGKSEADAKKLTKEVQKSPISPVWFGTRLLPGPVVPCGRERTRCYDPTTSVYADAAA